MKKLIFTIATICYAVLFAFAQTTLVTISGQVTDDVTGNPFPYHPVNIYCSDSFAFSYYNTVNTDINGDYIDSIDVPTGQPITFKVSTYDCNQSIQIVYVYTDSPPMLADFSICTGCQADFNALQDTTNYGWNFYFIDNSSGFNTSWSWSFGDGDSSVTQSPYHTYYSVDTFLVCLTIQDDYGCEDTFCDTLIIDSSNYVYTECNASFYVLPSDDTLMYYEYGWNPYTFIDNSSGFNTSWHWSFGDGDTSYSQSPTHTYYAVGSYIVCLTVYDDLGCEDTFCDTLIVDSSAYAPCHAGFNYNIDNIFTVNFYGGSNNPYANYDWDFGDGSYANNTQYPSHIYDTVGTFTVCLTITDSLGCNDSYCEAIDIITFFNISGYVLSSGDSLADDGTVYLIEYDSTTNMLTAIDTTNFNYNYFSFTDVDTGSYLVKAALDSLSIYYSDYLPTYYGDVLFWDDATYIFLYSNVYNITIHLIQGINPGGPGFIGGDVSQGANKLLAPGDPIADVEILLLNMDDSPVTYTYTEASGNFEFNNIAYGTYQVYTEITGKITYPVIVTIDSINPSVSNISILVNEDDIIASIDNNDIISQSYQNVIIYPNPFNSTTTFEIQGMNQPFTFELYNIIGEQVRAISDITKNKFVINRENLPYGIYIFKISSKDKLICAGKLIVN